jgi:type I restriction enzyme, S subunit
VGDLVFKGWFEKTPDKWDIFRMKNIMKPREGRSVTGEEELLSVTINGGVVRRSEYLGDDEGGSRSETLVGYKLVEPNNLVNNIMKMSFRCLGVSKHTGIVSPAYSVFDLNQDRVSPQYLDYLLRTDRYVFEYRKLSKGIQESRMRLYDDYFLSMKVVVPPLEEQKLISRYLDKKTEQIDSLIEKIQKKIELLKEQRTSLINQYVTKGLDPNVEMKDSGIEWIGEIPSHWEVSKTKSLSQIFGRIGYRGYTVDDIVTEGEGSITIGPGNIKNQSLDLSVVTFLSWDKYHESPEIQVFKNDIILVKTGSTIGKSCFVDEVLTEMTINPQMVILKSILIDPEYFYLNTICDFYQIFFRTEQTGSSTPTISQEKIINFPILNPPIQEQKRIVEFVKSKRLKIGKIIQSSETKIRLLKEYRQSLISSVVTGKVRITEDMI